MKAHVQVFPSGREFDVNAGETVLEAALRQGLAFPYGCRDGACGSCKGKVRAGAVAYPSGKTKALSAKDKAGGMALFCQAVPQGDLHVEIREVEAARGLQIRRLPCRVIKRERLSHDVMRLRIKLPGQERLQYLAGQYIDFLLRDGRRRSFSMANPPHQDEYLELHVRHVPGGRFTDYVFEQMKEKALLRFEGPLGVFFWREDCDRPAILMAGGTGFAPIKAMLEHVLDTGSHNGRPVHLYWGARALRDLYLADIAKRWEERYDGFRYTPVLSEPAERDRWRGRAGWVHDAVLADYPRLKDYQAYVSGPPQMIEAAKRGFGTAGLPDEFLFYDSFEYSVD